MLAVIRAFFAPKLALAWGVMTLYVMGCICLLAWLNLWTWQNLKSTLLWWVAVGFMSLHEAVRLKKKPDYFRELLLKAFTVTAVVVFIIELVNFSLWIDMLMLPSLVLLTLLAVIAEQRPEHAVVLRLLRVVQGLVGLVILGISLAMIMENAAKFWSLNTLREFGLPFLLWLLFVPFIFLLAVVMTYEESFVALQIRPKNTPIVGYVRWRTLLAFGLDMDAVRRLSRDLRNWDVCNKSGVWDAIHEIKVLQKRQKNPPPVNRVDGWSPYEARLFLKEHSIVTSDYHRTPWGWWADAPVVKLSDKAFSENISYSISGSEHAATQLHLVLNTWKDGGNRKGQLAFDAKALTLLSKVFGDRRAEDVFARVKSTEREAVEMDGVRVSYDDQEWGEDSIGCYRCELTIRHPRHVDD